MSKRIFALAALFLALCTASFSAGAGPQFTVALQGYDPVSFFEGSTPQKGDFMHAVHWNGTTWLFANDERAKRFKENPAKYVPQFDGYCAFAASRGYKAPGEALTGVVVEGKLYLNFNNQAKKLWDARATSARAKRTGRSSTPFEGHCSHDTHIADARRARKHRAHGSRDERACAGGRIRAAGGSSDGERGRTFHLL
jgi:YHS domain-containing protein